MEAHLVQLNSLAMTHRDIISVLQTISGLSSSRYRILLRVSESEQGVRATEVSEDLEFKFSTVAAVVNGLVEEGWVIRQSDPTDRRAFRLIITEEGKEILAHIDETLFAKLMERWNPLNREQFETILIDADSAHLSSDYVTSIEIPYFKAETILKKVGLTYTQGLILLLLDEFGDLRPKEISQKLDQKAATVSAALKKLEEKDLVYRYREDSDRSITNVHLTDKGQQALQKAIEKVSDTFDFFTHRKYTDSDRKKLIEISKLVVDAATTVQK